MEAQHYRKLWWDIILATVCFSVVPLFILGGVIYHQFSVSYTAKIMENMKTLAENRAGSITCSEIKDAPVLELAQGDNTREWAEC